MLHSDGKVATAAHTWHKMSGMPHLTGLSSKTVTLFSSYLHFTSDLFRLSDNNYINRMLCKTLVAFDNIVIFILFYFNLTAILYISGLTVTCNKLFVIDLYLYKR